MQIPPDITPRCREEDVDPNWWVEPDLEHGEENPSGKRDQLRAKLLCFECPILALCRASSWDEPAHVWGGLDPHERYEARTKGLVRRTGGPCAPTSLGGKYQQVFTAFTSGDTTERIAATLNLSEHTVMNYLRGMLQTRRDNRGDREPCLNHTPPPFPEPMSKQRFLNGQAVSCDYLADSA